MHRYIFKEEAGHPPSAKCFLMYTPFLKKRLYFEFPHRKKMWGSFLNNSISTQSFLKNWDSYILVSDKRVSVQILVCGLSDIFYRDCT